MVRLAAIGGHKAAWQQVARRLHRATLQWLPSEACSDLLPTACDALVLLDAGDDVLRRVDRYLWDGKHVLVASSKAALLPNLPPTSDANDARCGRLMIANPQRFKPSWQLIQQQVASGKLGEPGLVRIHHWVRRTPTRIDLQSRTDRPNHPTSPVPLDDTSWLPRSSLLSDLDAAVWLLGHSPEVLYASASQSADDAALDGRYVQVHLGFPQGGMALLVYTNRLPPLSSYSSLTAIGSAGAAHFDDHGNVQLHYRSGSSPGVVQLDEDLRQRTALVQSFVDGLAAGEDFTASIADWKTTWTLAAAVERSLKTRQAVTPEAVP